MFLGILNTACIKFCLVDKTVNSVDPDCVVVQWIKPLPQS